MCQFVLSYYTVICSTFLSVFTFYLLVSTSAIDCLERLVSEMTYCVSSGTLNPTHSLTHYSFCAVFNRLFLQLFILKTLKCRKDELYIRFTVAFSVQSICRLSLWQCRFNLFIYNNNNNNNNKAFIDIRLCPVIATPLATHHHTVNYGQT